VDGTADSYFVGFSRHKCFQGLLSTSRVSPPDLVVALRMKSKDSHSFRVLDEGYLHIVTVTTVITGSLPCVSRICCVILFSVCRTKDFWKGHAMQLLADHQAWGTLTAPVPGNENENGNESESGPEDRRTMIYFPPSERKYTMSR